MRKHIGVLVFLATWPITSYANAQQPNQQTPAVSPAPAVTAATAPAPPQAPVTPGSSLPDFSKPITVEQALEVAFCNNPDIKIAADLARRSRWVIAESRANFNPRFTATVNEQWQGPPVEVEFQGQNINIVSTTNTTANASVLLPLDINRRIGYATDISRLQFEADYLNLLATSERVIFNVKAAYYVVLRAQGLEDVARAALALSEARLKETQARFAAGTVPKFDVTRAQVDVSNQNQQVLQQANRAQVSIAALSRVMGIDVNIPLTVAPLTPPKTSGMTLDVPAEVNRAYANRPEVRQSERLVELSRKNVKLQRSDLLPTLAATGTVSYNVQASGFSGSNTNWVAGVGLSIPIWNGGITKARVAEAWADVQRTNDTLNQTKLGVGVEARTAALTLQEADKRIATTAEGVALAEEALRLATIRYNAGIATLVEVTDAQSALTEARNNNVTAMYDYATALADLQRATATQPELDRLQLLCPHPTS